MVLLIFTGDNESHLDLLTEAGELLGREETVEHLLGARSFVEFVAALNAPVK